MKKKGVILILVAIGIFVVIKLDLLKFLSIENIHFMQDKIKEFGILSPLIFIALYVIATILFLPALPLTLAGAVIFGPIQGFIYISVASVAGATGSFLIARALGRDLIMKKFGGKDVFKKIDKGVKEEGWKMLMITRLIPLFPFNLQNYIYGLTDIKLWVYILVSWVFMIPGTAAYVFLAGSILSGEGRLDRVLLYFTIGGGFLLLTIVLQKMYSRKKSK